MKTRTISRLVIAAIGVTGLAAATRGPATVKGANYRLRVQTQLPSFGGGPGGDAAGAETPGRGFGGFGGQSQLVRVDVAGNRAKVEFQVGAPPGSSLSDYYLMLLDSNKVYRISPDSQTYSDAVLAAGTGGRGGRGFGGPGGFGNRGGGRGGNGGGGAGAGGDAAGRGNRGDRGGNTFVNPMQVIMDAVVTGMKTSTEDLGASDAIEGRPTHKYRITLDYDFKLYGQPRMGKTTTEVWSVDFPVKIVDPFASTQVIGDSLSYAGIAARLAQEAAKVPGTHVKIVTTQEVPLSAVGATEGDVAANGQVAQVAKIVRTTLVTALKEADIDEGELAVPTGYKKVGFSRGGGQ
jgi:hypothetical protein